jgi:tetratricopeptide (TPR) repeat protein
MKLLLAKSGRRLLIWALSSVLLSAGGFRSEGWAQDTTPPGTLLPPPRANLLPLHWPDLTKLEPEVREQLATLQAALAVTARNGKSTDVILSEAYGLMGNNYQAYSLNSPARECYLNASRLAPRDFRWIYLLGFLDQHEDRVDDAIRQYRIAHTLRPEYVAVPVNLGNIFLQLDRLAEAHENFTAALAIDGSCAAALYGLGQVALSQRSYAEAAGYFEKALAVLPGANRIHYSLAMAYRALGDTEKAKEHLAQPGTVGVRVNDPLVDNLEDLVKGERVHLIRAMKAIEARRYVEAIAEFRQVLAANHNNITAHVNLGVALVQVEDFKGAAEHFAETLRIDPKNLKAHYNLAILLARENRHEEAVSHLQLVANLDPNDLGARFFLANELMKSDQPEAALKQFSQVVEADPNNEEALLEQVKLLERLGQYRQALNNLKRGHEQYPQKGQTALMLAYLLATSPQYDLRDGAESLRLARLIYNATGSIEHGAVVAMALAELGRCSEAAELQRRMIAAAEQQNKTDTLTKLKSDLKLYEGRSTCRPGE